jgi:hypothetical protein
VKQIFKYLVMEFLRETVLFQIVLELCMALVTFIPMFSERWIDCTAG